MRRNWSFVILSLITFVAPELVIAGTTLIDFENFNDGDVVTTQIPGVTFTNTIVLTAGISLNDTDFPPHSGSNVAFDNGGPVGISFGAPISAFSAYFTYAQPLTLDAFDRSNSLIASTSSSFPNNTYSGGFPGSAPNERLQIAAPGITRVTIAGGPQGDSFAIDDAGFTNATTVAPEPRCFMTTLCGLLACIWAAPCISGGRLRGQATRCTVLSI